MIYLDTSLLGAIFFREANAAELLGQLEVVRSEPLVISAWTLTEMASVAGIKLRSGVIDAAMRDQALACFQRFASSSLSTVEVEPADFRAAATFMGGSVALRAGDALHLAVARRVEAAVASLDRRLNDAASAFGIARIQFH